MSFTLAKLKPGKAIGSVRNFAATFNWLVDFCQNLSGGPGVEIDRTSADRPIIRIAANKELLSPRPWTVAWKDESWQVYIPPAALSILNFDVALEAADDPGWYIIQGQESVEGEEYFVVTAHIKYFCLRDDRTDINAVVVVDASAEESASDESCAGDIYTIFCAGVYVTEIDGAEPARVIQQSMKSTVYVEHRYNDSLGVFWRWENDTFPATFTPFVRGTDEAPICGGSLEETDLPADGDVIVWYLIDCTGESAAPSIETERQEEDADGLIYVKIFELSDGRIVVDDRKNLTTMIYYP